jgi:nucleoside phosphorylase/CheY-like chemotaxis protein
MRVLVVHDRKELLAEVTAFVTDVGGSRCVVDPAEDMVGARDLLRLHHYDLAIVDLTIPPASGIDDIALRNADWLLTQTFEGGDLKTPGDVIAISRDGEAVQGIRNSIGEHVLAVLTEDPDGLWKDRLKEKIAYVRNTQRSRVLATNSAFDMDVAIVTALDKEMRPYETLLEPSLSSDMEGAREFVLNSREGRMRRGILVSVGTSGQAPTAATTQAVLTQFRPQLIIMTGFCGGVEHKLQLGDIAAMRSSAPWDYGKWIEQKMPDGPSVPKFLPRGEAVPIAVAEAERVVRELLERTNLFDADALERVRALSGGAITEPKLRWVAAGSGSSVVTSTNTLGRIVEVNDAIHAVDMESYGFYQTCRRTPVVTPDYICIKGVADFCNGEKDDKLHAACSFLSAWLAIDIIRRHYDFSKHGDGTTRVVA